MALVTAIPVAFVAYWAYDVRSVWAAIDSAVESFEPPAGFEVIDTVRQGSGFCVITCTDEWPQVTIVMTWDGDPVTGCQRLLAEFDAVTEHPDLDDREPWQECGAAADLEQSVVGVASLAEPSRIRAFGPARVYAQPWANEIGVPSAPYVAWVTFFGQID